MRDKYVQERDVLIAGITKLLPCTHRQLTKKLNSTGYEIADALSVLNREGRAKRIAGIWNKS